MRARMPHSQGNGHRFAIFSDMDMQSPVDRSAEYTLSFRIEASLLDFDLIDELTGFAGLRSHIERKGVRLRTAPDFDCWEIEEESPEGDIFQSIDEAFLAFGRADVAADIRSAIGRNEQASYWWCGCFRLTSPSLTTLGNVVLDLIGRSGASFCMNTFHCPDEVQEEGADGRDDCSETSDEKSGHYYRFRFWDGQESCSSACDWGEVSSDFGAGFDAAINEYGGLVQRDGTMTKNIGMILCEHIQHAFDGGPVLRPDQALILASLGMSLLIVWSPG